MLYKLIKYLFISLGNLIKITLIHVFIFFIYLYIRIDVEIRYKSMNHPTFFTLIAPRRWTAASVGADRYRAAIGPLPIELLVFFIKIILRVIFIHSRRFIIKYAIYRGKYLT